MISRRKSFLAISLVLALAGCATTGDFAEQGQKANLAIEQTQNNMLLLNAIRASQRQPMHFTTISTVKTPLGTGVPTFTLGFPAMGPDRDARRFYAPSATYKPDTPNFDVTVWDGQAFMRGITTPVDSKTFLYYLDQGWPMQLLVALLVREIRVLDNKGKVERHHVNYPEDRTQFDDFQRAALTLSNCEFVFAKKKDPVVYGPLLSERSVSDPVAIAKIKEQGLVLAPQKRKVKQDGKEVEITEYQILKEDQSQIVKLVDRPAMHGMCKPFGLDPKLSLMASVESAERMVQYILALARKAESGEKPAPDTPPETHVIVFTLRSPEAALYHLGELARVQFTGAYRMVDGQRTGREKFTPEVDLGVPPDPQKRESQKLFVVSTDPVPAKPKPAAVAEYDGVIYWISSDPDVAGRSMRMITLVEQLISLQKDAKDMPATTTIRVSQ